MSFFDKLFYKKTANKLLETGKELEENNDLEGAFNQYSKAAKLGNADAMEYIAELYLLKQFRQVEISNLLELAIKGIPAFPWDVEKTIVPDYNSAFIWSKKAADLGHIKACYITGWLLCDGLGCQKDTDLGISYLKKAKQNGIKDANRIICLNRATDLGLSDSEYAKYLKKFVDAVESENEEMYPLYSALKGGTPKQLARLGYILTAANYCHKKNYDEFKFSASKSGIPLIPVAPKRGSWETFIRFDMNAFEGDNPLIAISSDILPPDYDALLTGIHNAVVIGNARYRSPAFGWLHEDKNAVVLRLDKTASINKEDLVNIVDRFKLIDEEYKGDNVAFVVENGEKEYSVEIACITTNKIEVLFRYTIGGSDEVKQYFEPKLLSLNINN